MTGKANKRALITGITGQDGSYLAELLLEKGYTVYGIIRRSSQFNTGRIESIFQDPHEKNRRFILNYGDLCDTGSTINLVNKIRPDEIYNLGAQSHVRVSFDVPLYTTETIVNGTLSLLEAIKTLKETGHEVRFYQASSSEMFGSSPPPQNEKTPFRPRSPYACAKVYAHNITVNYREAYGIFASSGILFNHESPRRGETFVTRKITRAIANILFDRQKKLYLGNLDARRDWGYAPDYVRAMWMMLQHNKPDDFVIATGESHSVREFLEEAFKLAKLNYEDYVEIDKRYFRPTEVDSLVGDSKKAREELGWKPAVKFKELVKIMLDADMERVKKEVEFSQDRNE
jgi:GDPmannose 4,6-dehydratase